MSEDMAGRMDAEIERGIQLRDAIDEELEKRGWKTTDKIEYEACVALIGSAINGSFWTND